MAEPFIRTLIERRSGEKIYWKITKIGRLWRRTLEIWNVCMRYVFQLVVEDSTVQHTHRHTLTSHMHWMERWEELACNLMIEFSHLPVSSHAHTHEQTFSLHTETQRQTHTHRRTGHTQCYWYTSYMLEICVYYKFRQLTLGCQLTCAKCVRYYMQRSSNECHRGDIANRDIRVD